MPARIGSHTLLNHQHGLRCGGEIAPITWRTVLNEIIESQTVTLSALTNALDNAVVDWMPNDEQTVYVTGNAFPSFQKIDSDRQFVVIWTYLDAVPCAEESELLAFVNSLNRRLVMVQFSYDAETHRVFGHYVLSYRDGFNTKQVIRAGRSFADIFDDAVKEGVGLRLLLPLENSTGVDEFFGVAH